MTIVIKKGATKEEVEKLFLKFDKKYSGLRKFLGKQILDTKVDAAAYQK